MDNSGNLSALPLNAAPQNPSLLNWTFHHVGIITPQLEETLAFYQRVAGYTEHVSIYDPLQDAKISLLHKHDSPIIELIQPSSKTSPSAGWIKRIQAGPYHTCYLM